jgi:hypothetical protein
MMDIDDIQATVREHLLGRLQGEERERLEEKFFTDPQFREVVSLIEGELFDDYTADSLSPADRESFIQQYVNAPRHSMELQFTAALQDEASHSKPRRQIKLQPPGSRESLFDLLTTKRWISVLAGATFVFALLAISWILIGGWLWGDKRAEFNAEIALLNKDRSSSAFQVELKPIQNRAPEETQKVVVPSGTTIVELRCHLPNQSYRQFQASLRTVSGSEVFTVDELQAEDYEGGKLIRLKVPGRVLTAEDYILSIKGLTSDSRLEGVADYFFRVSK